MIQITQVPSVERGRREDLGMTAGNPFFMAFENTQRELICVWSCRFFFQKPAISRMPRDVQNTFRN